MMLGKGYLAGDQFKASFAHQADHVAEYLDAVSETFMALADAVSWGEVSTRLKGPPAQKGFYRLTS